MALPPIVIHVVAISVRHVGTAWIEDAVAPKPSSPASATCIEPAVAGVVAVYELATLPVVVSPAVMAVITISEEIMSFVMAVSFAASLGERCRLHQASD